MFELVVEEIQYDLMSVLIALVIWAVALVAPFRQMNARPDLRWDSVALVAGIPFGILAGTLLDQTMEVAFGGARVERWQEAVTAMPLWILVVINFVFADFAAYWAHRLLHTRVLWSTHAWHHSPSYLWWVSGLRGSPIHAVLLLAPYYLVFVAFPSPETGLAAGIVTVIDIANQHYIHSNLRVPFARQLEYVFVTPRFHFVHHSAMMERTNSNYGFVFSWWDRMFGTFTDPDTVAADDQLGLDYEISNWRLVLGIPARKTAAFAASPNLPP